MNNFPFAIHTYPLLPHIAQIITETGRAVGSLGLVAGQVVDIECEGAGEKATLDTLQYIHKHKTAALLEASVVCGALCGGASDEEVENLRSYATNIGLAFQVVDDILDITQTTEELGKTAGKDLLSEKTTYPALLGLEESKAVADKLIADAKKALEPYDKELAAPLVALANYIRYRTN